MSTEQMSDAEAEAWDDLWDTDAARCCSCPGCNFYAPDYEKHASEPCVMQTIIERIIAARAADPTRTVHPAGAADTHTTGAGA